MSGQTWYRQNPEDFLQGTQGMAPELVGVYITVLQMMYRAGGPIRDDHQVIGAHFHMHWRSARALIDKLVEAGKLIRTDGMLSNRRFEREIGAAIERSSERAQAGAKGGRNRRKSAAGEAADGLPKPPDEPPCPPDEGGLADPLTPLYPPLKPPFNAPASPPTTPRQEEKKPNEIKGRSEAELSLERKREKIDKKEPPTPPIADAPRGAGGSALPDPSKPPDQPDPIVATRKAISAAFAARGALPPDMHRVAMWRTQGYPLALIEAVIAEIMATAAAPPSTLAYFDAPIRRAHEGRAKPMPAQAEAQPADERRKWATMMRAHATGNWIGFWGGKPGEPDCKIPVEFQNEWAKTQEIAA